jgi:uncharacterized protein (DUF342 family)
MLANTAVAPKAAVALSAAASPARELRQAQRLLDRIAQSMEETGLSRLLDEPNAASAEDFIRMLEGVDFSGVMGRDAMETAGPELAARELAGLDLELAPIRDAELRVKVSSDGMTVEAFITPPSGVGRPMNVTALLAALGTEHNIARGIDRDAVDRLVEAGRTAAARAVVAWGLPPAPGRAEEWKLAVPTTKSAPRARAAADDHPDAPANDRVDYHELTARKAVAVGDLLASRVAPEPGRAGINVHDEVVQPPELPRGRILEAGSGAEKREDGIHAMIAGEILIEGDKISVVPVRRIDGDVDFSTGNVDFPGSVFIKGSVLDGFSVRAGGDIEIGGSIAGAHVEAKGSVRVRGGIVGHGKGMVLAGGAIEAKFIENARVEARDGVRVRKGILHSHVDTLGLVEVTGEPGAVVGGHLRAGAGLRCRFLGAVAGAQTRVTFGENYLVFRKLEVIDRAVAFLRDRARDVDASLGPFKAADAGALTAEDGAILKKLLALRTKLMGNLRRLMTSRVAALAEAESAPEGDVRVRDETHAGVILSSRGADRPIAERHVHTRFRLADDRIEVCPFE